MVIGEPSSTQTQSWSGEYSPPFTCQALTTSPMKVTLSGWLIRIATAGAQQVTITSAASAAGASASRSPFWLKPSSPPAITVKNDAATVQDNTVASPGR